MNTSHTVADIRRDPGQIYRAIWLVALICLSTLLEGRLVMAEEKRVGRVTGIGGVFFLAGKDNAELARWYQTHLGIDLEAWGGGVLQWQDDTAEDGGATVWHVAAPDSDWFAPSKSRFMK